MLTAHAAKGLEFPVVFVPNLAKDRFPGRGRKGQAVAPGVLAIDEAAARAADDRCLFFVALSRARDRLILSRAERYGGRAHPPSPLLALAEPAFAAEPPVRVWWPAVQADPDLAVEEVPDHGVPVAVEPPVTGPAEVDLQGLETYLQCPRRFYYGEQLGLRGAGDGQGFPHFHRVVRRALARLRDIDQGADVQAGDVPRPEVGEMQGGDPAGPGGLERALQVLAEEWAADHVPHPYEGLYLERARRMVSTAQHAATTTSGASSHDVEYAVVRPAGVVRVRVDRVDQPPDGPPVAVRYRSGRPAGDHRRDHRTALYQAALQAAHGAGSVHQEYLSTGVADQAQARASTMESRLRECDGALAGIARGEFPTRTGDHCPTCPFWLICPATG